MGPFVNSVACLQKDHKKYPNLFCFVWPVNPEDSEKGLDIFWVWISEIIWADADAGSLFLREGGIPEAQKVFFQPAGTVWMVLPVRKESYTFRKQTADPAVIGDHIFYKLS